MNNPLAIIAIVICTAFFGLSWSVTIGHWLNVRSLIWRAISESKD